MANREQNQTMANRRVAPQGEVVTRRGRRVSCSEHAIHNRHVLITKGRTSKIAMPCARVMRGPLQYPSSHHSRLFAPPPPAA